MVNDLPYERIAEILDLQLGTVKSRLARARMQLKKFLRTGTIPICFRLSSGYQKERKPGEMMMNCEQALEAISARLDGALSEEENRELETHLASCASCRALLKELTELEEGLETLPVEAPETLAPSVMRTIRAEKGRAGGSGGEKKPAARATYHGMADRGGGRAGAAAGRGGRDRPSGLRRKRSMPPFPLGMRSRERMKCRSRKVSLPRGSRRSAAARCWPCRGCTDGIEALSGLDYETLDGGAKLYEVPAEVTSGIMDAWQTAYPMQVYAPQEASAADSGNACILLLP